MSSLPASRTLPVAASAEITVADGNRSVIYARRWLELLGGAPTAETTAARIAIVAGEAVPASAEADCVIRLWDFQVGLPGSGALASAVSGAAAVIGHAGRSTMPLPADMPEKWCGAYGVILALAELWRRRNGGSARAVYDVSAADVLRSFCLQNAGDTQETIRRWRRNGRFCVEHGGIFPMGFFACRDGHVALLGRSRRDWRQIRQAIGDPDWAKDAAFEDPFAIAQDSAEADALLEASLAQFDRDDLLARGLAAGAVIAPVYSQDEALGRGIFRPDFIGGDGPAMPFLVEELASGAEPKTLEAGSPPPALAAVEAPLAGLRCIELCWVWSGPMVGQILADLGAEVIKVESPGRFDLYRTRGLEAMRGDMPEATRIESSIYFHSLNRNKLGLALDLKAEGGLATMKRLAAYSDLLIENFTVGTMARLGLGTAALAEANPALVQLSMSGPGSGSAVEDLRSYGLVLSALAGAESLIRLEGEFLGSPTFSISDPNAAAFAAMAALSGVLAAGEDGRGRAIDLSQIEAAATLAGAPTAEPRNLEAALRTAEGTFVIASVPRQSVEDVAALCRRLDGRTRTEIIGDCEALGGQAADVRELEETDAAPEFAGASAWLPSTHPFTGDEMLVAAPWRVDGHRPGLRKPAPLLGEGDDYVLRRVLGLSHDEIEGLTDAGAVGTKDQEDDAGRTRR
jgi:crotonobetainyl-CoA:carnitine CoA-transferase CaiB-like acyl-CoA transferase